MIALRGERAEETRDIAKGAALFHPEKRQVFSELQRCGFSPRAEGWDPDSFILGQKCGYDEEYMIHHQELRVPLIDAAIPAGLDLDLLHQGQDEAAQTRLAGLGAWDLCCVAHHLLSKPPSRPCPSAIEHAVFAAIPMLNAVTPVYAVNSTVASTFSF